MSLIKSLILATEICATLYITRKIFWYFVERQIKNRRKHRGTDYLRMNKGLLFGLDNVDRACVDPSHKIYCMNWKSCNDGKLHFMLDLIRNARDSVDVCVYIIMSDEIGRSIIESKNRGARVRVITDADMALSKKSFVHQFSKSGIPVKFKSSNFIMHHKFVVIDNEIVIMGSMNFTSSSIDFNWESVVVTTVPKFVKDYSQNFDKLWRYIDR